MSRKAEALRLVITSAFLAVLTAPGTTARRIIYVDAGAHGADVHSPVTVSASALKDFYDLGEEVPLTVTIVNSSPQPVYIYVDRHGFLLGLTIRVKDKDGITVAGDPSATPPPPPRHYYVEIDGETVFTVPVRKIEPGQTVTANTADALEGYHGHLQEGTYYLTPNDMAVVHDVDLVILRDDVPHPLWIDPLSVAHEAKYKVNTVEIRLRRKAIIYVDADAAGANNGLGWPDAYNSLQDALADANSAEKPVNIRVAQGVYKPDQGAGITPGDRTRTFQLNNGVAIRGGYAGLGEPDPNVRDINEYGTVLSGDLKDNDNEGAMFVVVAFHSSRLDNSYNVVTGSGTNVTAVLDGFAITGGNDNRYEPGGREGTPIGFGGGMCNESGSPTVINCTLSANSASWTGGAIYNHNSSPTFTNCIFSRNHSTWVGGGMYNSESNPTLNNCVFTGNTVVFDGGGMANWQDSNSRLSNCTFSGNRANFGGAVCNYDSSLALANCTFSGNVGYGLACTAEDFPSNAQATNCIFWDSEGGKNIVNNKPGARISIFSCNVKGGRAGIYDQFEGVVWGDGNMDADPCFADAGHWEDPCDTPYSETDDIWVHGDYHLQSRAGRWEPTTQSWVRDEVTSPCIDAGDPISPIGHEPFPNGGLVNMGAYGGTAEASKSYFGEPVCETVVAGDINGDCRVDLLDFRLMALHWLWDNNCQSPEFCDDWSLLWKRGLGQIPSPVTVEVGQTGGLGEDLENRQWLMMSTQYHEIYFQQSTDENKIAELYCLIDNIYEFLKGRSPAKAEPPIKAFIVPNQLGHSRCSMLTNAMRTGDQGDIISIVTSLLHEETHLFNFAFLQGKAQGWWAGEFTCIYFQTRAGLQAQGKNVKNEICAKLPDGPLYHLGQIAGADKAAFDEAVAAMFFFEQKYGSETLNRFRRACLEAAKATDGGELQEAVFCDIFGTDMESLEKQWLEFYGWTSIPVFPPISDPRLMTEVSFFAERASVQTIALNIAEQAGIGYNWQKSYSQTDPECRKFIWDVQIDNQPLHQALEDILAPQDLTYRIEEGEIVLYRSWPSHSLPRQVASMVDYRMPSPPCLAENRHNEATAR
ncbi:MAG: hypothetical protein JSU70_13135 [Phycisphaerales bacterium]|nr:MAG: hypothetical protein JSU70_13135 [Phycisphaerales bacterium]